MANESPAANVRSSRRWVPIQGPELTAFLNDCVPPPSQETIKASAISILGNGIPPSLGRGYETGLVVGYVQSGKTMSFEAVTAVARDNGFQVVIVVAGISNNLLAQSGRRLLRDLHLDNPDSPRRWMHFENPICDDTTLHAIRDVLEDWSDVETPENYRKTVLITVLKQHKRLSNLSELMRGLNLDGVPVLVIDDEADQASLNNDVAQGQESTTYRCLMALREALPMHTYLQYTATPQAPLLVSIIDSLSPNFVEVLTPGDAYVGGQHFFGEGAGYVRVIPPQDVPTNTNQLNDPPQSLLDALRIFMVGIAAGLMRDENRGNRSMLVHPSHRTEQHQEFYNWVRDIFDNWKRILGLPDDDNDKQDLVGDFRDAYSDLERTAGDQLPDFNELIRNLRIAFRNTRVLEVNARGGSTPQVDWGSTYGWILVGGQAMDRGFTVEGLTVTYMPRGIGAGNADTIQQRARFFGYKRAYFGFCRVYLEQATLDAFQKYVQHEEDIRAQLSTFQAERRPLNEWKRAFVLDRALRPCRQHVLEFDYIRGCISNSWVAPRVVLASESILATNRMVVDSFVQGLEWAEDEGHRDRTEMQRHHEVRNLSLAFAVERLLVEMRISGITDSQKNTGMLLQLSKALEGNPNERCTVYRMSKGTSRQRSIDLNGEVLNIFQGEDPVLVARRGEVYPGDRAIRDQDNVTIQIHTLDLLRDRSVVAERVAVLAVWIPVRLRQDWVVQ